MVKSTLTPAVSTPASPNTTSPYIGTISTTYGQLSINSGDAADHASMLGAQLSGLLLLIGGDDCESFKACNTDSQASLLWLARNLAKELTAVVPLVSADSLARGAA